MSARPITVIFEIGTTPTLSGGKRYLARLSEHNDAVCKILSLCGFEWNGVAKCWSTLEKDGAHAAAVTLGTAPAVLVNSYLSNVLIDQDIARDYIREKAACSAMSNLYSAFSEFWQLSRRIENEQRPTVHKPPVYSPADGDVFK